MDPFGKKGYGSSGKLYLDNCVHMKMDIEVLVCVMEPEKRRGLSELHPEVLDERSQQKCPAF